MSSHRDEFEVLPTWMKHGKILDSSSPSVPIIGSFDLNPVLLNHLTKKGLVKFFPIQTEVIPIIIQAAAVKNDVCICAPTGSGKTLAYALPIINV